MNIFIILSIILSIILVVFILLIALESIRECGRYKIREYTFHDIHQKDFKSLKIAMLADLHNTFFDGENESIVDSVKKYKPDIIILAGDMVVCREKQVEKNLRTATFLNKLCDIAPVFYSMGNHEKGLEEKVHDVGNNWEEYVALLDKRINICQNNNISFTKDKVLFSIYGLDLDRDYYGRFKVKPLMRQDLIRYLGMPKEGAYNILVAHNPDYFGAYEKWGANLVLSGHNHGGLVRIPFIGGVISPRLHIFPKYTYGLYESSGTKMLLSNGLGSHSLKIRVNNIPEIVFIQIKGK